MIQRTMIPIDEPSERQLMVVRAQLETAKSLLLELMGAADPERFAQYDTVLSLLFEASKRLNAMVLAGNVEGPPQ